MSCHARERRRRSIVCRWQRQDRNGVVIDELAGQVVEQNRVVGLVSHGRVNGRDLEDFPGRLTG
jgi:hypothetical protein